MKTKNLTKQNSIKAKLRPGKTLWLVLTIVAVLAAVAGFLHLRGEAAVSGNSDNGATTFTVKLADLPITVTESGNIKAINSIVITNKVEGRATIISIVDEGTIITPEDVNNGKILVELDASEFEQKLTQQEVTFLSAEASYADANESLEIQRNQNDSDIQEGQLKVKFALMDLKKYLSEAVAEELISKGPDDIASLIESLQLGGEAKQRLRELESDIDLKGEELEQAKNDLQWTEKLEEKEYVSESELKRDQLKKKRTEIFSEKAKTSQELFKRYEFPKQAEKLYSDYIEAQRELERIEARARSKLAKAKAKLGSSRATFLLQKRRLQKYREQLEACIIKAPAPGHVIYSSTTDRYSRERGRIIEVGAEVRERQHLISIPDLSAMKVGIRIHEMWIDKIELGQKARVTIAAFADLNFDGKVLKKSPMAVGGSFFDRDTKSYATDISIDGTHDCLKTGMTAKVEIIIKELKGVISVPIQAVINQDGRKICYVAAGSGSEARQVETGDFNTDFVEIKSGLDVGEEVLLNPQMVIGSTQTEDVNEHSKH
ncbi:MAG: efflux RND transporter periplasmic adaptor subunit [Planctomycetota bacterium]